MKKILTLILFLGTAVTISANDTLEQQAVAIVNDFLTYLDSNEPFSYDREKYFFGDHSILATVLYMQTNMMHSDGRWKAKSPSNSLLGHTLKQENNILRFSRDSQKFVFCEKDNNSNSCFVICLYQKKAEKSQVSGISNPEIAKVLVFRVTNFIRPNIDLLESSIDGISIPYLLGFRVKDTEVKSAGKSRKKDTLTFSKEKLNYLLKNYIAD